MVDVYMINVKMQMRKYVIFIQPRNFDTAGTKDIIPVYRVP